VVPVHRPLSIHGPTWPDTGLGKKCVCGPDNKSARSPAHRTWPCTSNVSKSSSGPDHKRKSGQLQTPSAVSSTEPHQNRVGTQSRSGPLQIPFIVSSTKSQQSHIITMSKSALNLVKARSTVSQIRSTTNWVQRRLRTVSGGGRKWNPVSEIW